MKKIIFSLFFIFLIIGCGGNEENPFENEMDNCSHDGCGYWKHYLTEKTENNKTDETYEIGDQYIKLTANAFEETRYIEGEVSSYENHEITIQNNGFSAGGVNYTFEKVGDDIILTYNIGNSVVKEYYQNVAREEYPQFAFNNEDNSDLKTIYNNSINDCTDEMCGYWKINNITRDCVDVSNMNVDMNKYSYYQYLKIGSEKLDAMNYSSENDFNIVTSYYLNDETFMYFSNSKITSENLTLYENARYAINGNSLTISQVVIDKLYNNEVCGFNYNYTKIDGASYPKITIYKY